MILFLRYVIQELLRCFVQIICNRYPFDNKYLKLLELLREYWTHISAFNTIPLVYCGAHGYICKPNMATLNNRNELATESRHKHKYLLKNLK